MSIKPSVTLLLVLLTAAHHDIGKTDIGEAQSQPVTPASLPRSKLSKIARHVITRGNEEQREFVLLSLDAMINAYSQVLQHSSESQAHSPSGSRKQVTWGWATSRLIASLINEERKIESGMPFTLYVDHMQQITILIEGRVILVSGPHTSGQSYFEQQVIDFYCLTRDCSWLNPPPVKLSRQEKTIKSRLSKGVWYFQKETGPIFVIGGLIYFEFPDFTDKANKAELSYKITDEVKQLVASVHKLNKKNKAVDWRRIRGAQPQPGDSRMELISSEPQYDMQLEQLSRLRSADWMRLVTWMESNGFEKGAKLKLRQLTHML